MPILSIIPKGESYDIIVVGAGSSGAVIASRLSENTGISVLLLEAGENDEDFPDIYVPVKAVGLRGSSIDWQYYTEPQKNSCYGLINKRSYWPRGKVLGGSSALNHMQYIRGSRHDYDYWQELGCEGWSYQDVLPYFIKSERFDQKFKHDTGYHGKSGPINVTLATTNPIGPSFVQAAKELGHKILDPNGRDQIGFSASPVTRDTLGQRVTTSGAYIHPARNRPNFTILTKAHVTKVIFSGTRAVGVEFFKGGVLHAAMCRHEIVLSGGTIGSAHILLLSGVGPRGDLEQLKIPVVADLPVGRHLQDHLFVDGIEFFIEKPFSVTDKVMNSQKAKDEFLLHGTGPLTSPGTNEAVGFYRTPLQPGSIQYPDIQLHVLCCLRGRAAEKAMKMKPEIWKALHGDMENKHGFNIHIVLLHPKSEGFIKLRSTNPFDHPIIDPCYLEDPQDVKVLTEGVKFSYRLIETDSMKALGARPTFKKLPDCEHLDILSDEYLEKLIRTLPMTLYHPTGTCKMGAVGDKTAVVDNLCRVKGIQGLRVADCSIMPEIISGNTNAPAIMIGEKVSNLIYQSLSKSSIQSNL